MVYTREQAATRAEASHTNEPGTCQLWTRNIFGAPSAGDRDHDGASDAEDGWASEPAAHRHPGDHNAPRGVPVAWGGGSHDNGHRAVSLGHGLIRSTDAAGSGHVATVPLGWVETNWGLPYLGWSETITGIMIPGGDTEQVSPWSKGEVYVDKLHAGQSNSDSVRRLQFRLRNLDGDAGSPNLPVTGNYLANTIGAVRKWQAQAAVERGPNNGRLVDFPQANRMFGDAYTVIA